MKKLEVIYYYCYDNIDYIGTEVTYDDETPTAHFANNEEYEKFLKANGFKEHNIQNLYSTVVTDEVEPNIVGRIVA